VFFNAAAKLHHHLWLCVEKKQLKVGKKGGIWGLSATQQVDV
jgi:hypothetical protein